LLLIIVSHTILIFCYKLKYFDNNVTVFVKKVIHNLMFYLRIYKDLKLIVKLVSLIQNISIIFYLTE